MVHCETCNVDIEDPDSLEQDEVAEVDIEPDSDGPRIRIGTGKRDVWRCKDCGKVLGVR